jgi:predicted nucleic acid-binding protein
VRLYVVDARVAIKWVIAETGTPEALTLRRETRLIAPDLLVAECVNIPWKKVRRNELSMNEAPLAALVASAGPYRIAAKPGFDVGYAINRNRIGPSDL